MLLKWMPIGMIVSIAVLLSACGGAKKITYMEDVPDSIYSKGNIVNTAPFREPKIKENDILQISILTLDPESNHVLTASNSSNYSIQPGSSSTAQTPGSVPGFMVDTDGMIELPLTGRIKVSGMTTKEAKEIIRQQVSKMYKSPVVNVRFANFNISVLGEVNRPANYVVPNEKISILDAIGMAGDLTIYGKRENILLVRDSIGQKIFARFNLNESSIVQSPYYYLQQGDIIYVEPAKSKVASTDAARTRNISLIASGISLLIVIASRL